MADVAAGQMGRPVNKIRLDETEQGLLGVFTENQLGHTHQHMDDVVVIKGLTETWLSIHLYLASKWRHVTCSKTHVGLNTIQVWHGRICKMLCTQAVKNSFRLLDKHLQLQNEP